MIRLSKCIADSGLCSRRQAVRLIAKGSVSLNGEIATGNGWIDDEEVGDIRVKGSPLKQNPKPVYIAYNKPVGIDCNYSESNKASLINHINLPQRVFPVGRLDKDSHGLLVLTNDGELCQRLMHPRYKHNKSYRVKVSTLIEADFIEKMSSGVSILDTVTLPCQVTQTDTDEFIIVLTQGLNRQIRRMCKQLGYYVTDLQRTTIVNIELNSLEEGKFRALSNDEVTQLKKFISSQ